MNSLIKMSDRDMSPSELLDDDEIDAGEEGFMMGYEDDDENGQREEEKDL